MRTTCSAGCALARNPSAPALSTTRLAMNRRRLGSVAIALPLRHRKLGDLVFVLRELRLDLAVAKALVWVRCVPRNRQALRLRAWRRQRKHQRFRRMVGD